MRILVIGKSGRLAALVDALYRSSASVQIYVLSEVRNPSLTSKAIVRTGIMDDKDTILAFAKEIRPHFAVIGPEEPLAAGAVGWLREIGIPCVGPTKLLAQIETSKSFARTLLTENNIPGNPRYRIFHDLAEIPAYLRELGAYVVKPDGLTGGKGVKVFGDHLQSDADAIEYCAYLLQRNSHLLIEEKLEGEEFSFLSFCDGRHVAHMIPVQDHKRALEKDLGPNTGGMGSYSCSNHLLPFLSDDDIHQTKDIHEKVLIALQAKIGQAYKGILYGNLILTAEGVRVIEFNARFGDPEALNVLPLLKSDFVEVCLAIINGNLDEVSVEFDRKATVCKYVVPEGYPNSLVKGEEISLHAVHSDSNLKIYHAAVMEEQGRLFLTGSRAVAFVGIGESLPEAEARAESAAALVEGPVYHRRDIGTAALVQQRVDHMEMLWSKRREGLRRAG